MKKFSWKITFIIGLIILIVAGSVAIYMQTRIIEEIGIHSRLSLQYQKNDTLKDCNFAFLETLYMVTAIKNLAEVNFDLDAFKKDPESHFDETLRPVMNGFVSNFIAGSDVISAAYFSVYPDLAASDFVNEIYFARTEAGVIAPEPDSYEEFMQYDREEAEWFYGAFDSKAPYWSSIYIYDGQHMVSYAEPVFVDGIVVGVAGADIFIKQIEDMIKSFKVYETGFGLLKDNSDEFFESNDFISNLDLSERKRLSDLAQVSAKEVFEIKVGDTVYLAASTSFFNDYELFVLAPKKEANAKVIASLIRFIIIFATAYTLVLIAAYFIGNNIGKPISAISTFLNRAGTTGNINYQPEEQVALKKYAQGEDEIGKMISDCQLFINHVRAKATELEAIAGGDLTRNVDILSDEDVMGTSVNHMIKSLNRMFREINASSQLVAKEANHLHDNVQSIATNTTHLAEGAQLLAEGSTEQAASINILIQSADDIANKTKSNTRTAEKAASLADAVIINAQKGSRQMDEMIKAVNDITAASHEISTIIETINEIASQTNLLSLNAAIEAARAGEHGRGFAVVADEVGKLAVESTKAADGTHVIIKTSIEKAELGVKIVDETAASLNEIIVGIKESSQLIKEIANASEEQLTGIRQINNGIHQVSEIVVQNSATAEESADASEKSAGAAAESAEAVAVMRNLAEELHDLISQFKLGDF